MGSHFQLRTDHQPLEFIFNPSRELPRVVSSRILRWALRLMEYDFQILYTPGKLIPHVDALSRLATHDTEADCMNVKMEFEISLCDLEPSLTSTDDLKQAMLHDEVAKKVLQRIKTNKWSNCSPAERPFKNARAQLSNADGLLLFGERIYVPPEVRNSVIKKAHCLSHPGINATNNIMKNSVWWPAMRGEIETYIRKCDCQNATPPKNDKVFEWPQESKPWSRVHMDHAQIPNVGLVLILVDSMSAWPEVVRVSDRSTRECKKVIQEIFSRLGVPNTLVSDNAAEFCDDSLIKWLLHVGCKPVKTPPYHPSSNGLAERMVRTIKDALRGSGQSVDFDAFLQRLLLNYRVTPHGDRTKSPDELMGRKLRNPLTCNFNIGEELLYWKVKDQRTPPEAVRYLYQKGYNTVVIERNQRKVLAHLDQLKSVTRPPRNEVSMNQENISEPPNVRTTENHRMSPMIDMPTSGEYPLTGISDPNSTDIVMQPKRENNSPTRISVSRPQTTRLGRVIKRPSRFED